MPEDGRLDLTGRLKWLKTRSADITISSPKPIHLAVAGLISVNN